MSRSDQNYREPVTPKYANTDDIVENLNGSSFGDNINTHFIRVIGDHKPAKVIGDDTNIFVTETEKAAWIEYLVTYDKYIAGTVDLSIASPSGIQLLGTTVTDVTLEWTYTLGSKPILSQTLYIDDVETAMSPTQTGANSYSLTLSGQNITSDTVFKISGSDGVGNIEDTATLAFGNYFYHGQFDESITSVPGNFVSVHVPAADNSLILHPSISTITFTAASTSTDVDWVAIPESLWKSSYEFKDRDNVLPGGFQPLGDPNTVTIPNSTPNEPNTVYYVWRSINRNISGSIFDIT